MDKHSLILAKKSSTNFFYTPPVNIKAFKIENLLGRGSYAKVFRVTKNDTGKVYAMKVLKKAQMEDNKDVMRVYNEKDIIKDIDHPFIIKLHYTFQNKKKAYFILDYLNGGDLYTQIMTKGSFKEANARFYTAEIVLALGHLHEKGIVYRDLKPQNIIIDSDGHIKLTDFGLSKANFDRNVKNSI